MNSNRDAVAREAARLIEIGRETSIAAAIRTAMESRGGGAAADRPSHGQVRRHLQGFAMQSAGVPAYHNEVARILQIAEEVMTILEDNRPILVGRAAKAQIDGGVTLHLRVYTTTPIGEIAHALVEFGYDEPTFNTINTRWGRLNRLSLDDDGQPIQLTRCLPDMWAHRARSLHRDQPVAIADLAQVRTLIHRVLHEASQEPPADR